MRRHKRSRGSRSGCFGGTLCEAFGGYNDIMYQAAGTQTVFRVLDGLQVGDKSSYVTFLQSKATMLKLFKHLT